MERFYTRLFAAVVMFTVAACGVESDEPQPDTRPSKSELAERLSDGRADTNVDWCDIFDWYDDGVCDDFCLQPDPDCSSTDPGDGGYEPCGGLSCGDACSVCDPSDPNCFETAVLKMCQPDGTCAATVPVCDGGDTYEPCGGLSCGDSCSVCDPSDPNCFETAVLKMCQPDGTCAATVPQCDGGDDAYEPCGALSCGDSCSLCDPSDPDCVETAVLKMCQPDGTCAATVPVCDGGDGDWTPCGGLACGDSCTTCAPNDPDCVETAELKFCQADGTCMGVEPQTCDPTDQWDPCEGKTCGDSCTLCDPDDPTCVETLSIKECNDEGVCSDTLPVCM